jgi:hypothetical protein
MFLVVVFSGFFLSAAGQSQSARTHHPVVLHAARLLDVKNGRLLKPGEVLVQGDRIVEAGPPVKHPAGAEVMERGRGFGGTRENVWTGFHFLSSS